MPSMGLGLGLGLVRSGSGLNFSALAALPSGRQSAVTTAANTAAATLSVTPQSIIDALSVGRGLCSMLPNDGCLLASSGGAVTVQGDPVGAIRSWTGVELATQSNASLRPVSAADGLFANGSNSMQLGNFSSWTTGFAQWVGAVVASGGASESSRIGLWDFGTSAVNNGLFLGLDRNQWFDDFGQTTRPARTYSLGFAVDQIVIYQAKVSSNISNARVNNSVGTPSNVSVTTSFNSAATLFTSQDTTFYTGISKSLLYGDFVPTTNQENAIREFCKAYYGVTY